MHAGFFKDSTGGCAAVQLTGNYTNFLSSYANGFSSLGFPSTFPLSFRFSASTSLKRCSDLRNVALAFNVIVTCLIFLVLRPRPIVRFWCLFCIGFWHISLFSQTRSAPPDLEGAFATFLPALFIGYGFWRLAFRFTMPVFSKSPIEGTILYLGPYWIGVLHNLVLDRLPIGRLLASDLRQQRGAIASVVIVSIVILAAAVNQMRVMRKTGWLPHYLRWYFLGGLITVVLVLLPGLQFRLHHYILAMVLIPGTAFPTRISAVSQGFLLGMFLNGVAAFGIDSILQTAAALRRDAPMGSALPTFLTNSTNFNASIALANQTVFWQGINEGDSWNGFELIIDDVLRYSGPALNFSLASLQAGIPHFFRLAFVATDAVGDFTKPATLWPNGTWVDPLPGPS